MKFSIFLANHPEKNIQTTRDHTLIIQGGLQEAGHFCQLTMFDIFADDCVNLIYDRIKPENIDYFRSMVKTGIRFGLITTEVLDGERFNRLDNSVTRNRLECTREIAQHAEFIWVMHEPSLMSWHDIAPKVPCFPLPLGYARKADELHLLPWERRDIDFLFFGRLSEHRQGILNALQQKGYQVAHLYNAPGFIRNSMIERTKVNLALKQDVDWEWPSIGRICYLVSNGCFVMAEETATGSQYEQYVSCADSGDFVEECAEALTDPTNLGLARALRESFIFSCPMKTIMSDLVEQTFAP